MPRHNLWTRWLNCGIVSASKEPSRYDVHAKCADLCLFGCEVEDAMRGMSLSLCTVNAQSRNLLMPYGI
jgi:hypothetical protein